MVQAHPNRSITVVVLGPFGRDTGGAILDISRGNPGLMFGAFAEFERAMMLERQRPGIEKAKAEGRYKGRKPTAMNQRARIKALEAEGMTRTAIAGKLGISERSVYRALVAL